MSVKAHRRARQALITMAIAAFVSAGAGAGASAAGSPAPAATATTNGVAADGVSASLVRIRVTANRRSRTGGGVIIRSDGYILIRANLVSGMGRDAQIAVTIADGRQAPARLVGIDDAVDLAVLQVSGLGELAAATFADTHSVTGQQAASAPHAGITLLDLQGRIIGIATSSSTGQPVPADQAARAAVELIAAG